MQTVVDIIISYKCYKDVPLSYGRHHKMSEDAFAGSHVHVV